MSAALFSEVFLSSILSERLAWASSMFGLGVVLEVVGAGVVSEVLSLAVVPLAVERFVVGGG